MAEVQRNVRIKLVPRSKSGGVDKKVSVLKPIYFPAIISTDTTTGKFRLSVNVAAANAQQDDYKIIANMAGLNSDSTTFDNTVQLAQDGIFGIGNDGADFLLTHLENTNNLGELENIVGDLTYRKEFVMQGIHYGDKEQGLLQARELSAGIFNEEAGIEERQKIVAVTGNDAYATTPSAEEISEAEELKTDDNVDPNSSDEDQTVQFNGFDVDPARGVDAQFAGGKNFTDTILSYPEDLSRSQQDYLKISCYIYKPQSLAIGRVASRSGASGTKDGPDIYLPITGASDTNTVGWGEQNANPLQIGLYQAAASTIDADLSNLGNLFSNLGKSARELIKQDEMLRPAIKSYFAGAAAGVNGMLARTTGAIFNPNIVLLFNTPELRKFSFTFRMSARSETEAVMIRKIIRFFKQQSRPGTSGAQLFLTTPNVFKVEYKVAGGGVHKSIGQPKDACALTSVGVNYVPDGSYMTFDDEGRTMTSFELTLGFSELEPIYRGDYIQDTDQIGW